MQTLVSISNHIPNPTPHVSQACSMAHTDKCARWFENNDCNIHLIMCSYDGSKPKLQDFTIVMFNICSLEMNRFGRKDVRRT